MENTNPRTNPFNWIVGIAFMLGLGFLIIPPLVNNWTGKTMTTPQVGIGGAPNLFSNQITDINDITSRSTITDLVGRDISLSDVRILGSLSDRIIFIGNNSARMFIAHVENEAGDESLENAEAVNLQGTIHRMPDVNVIQEEWGVDQQTAERISAYPMYVSIRDVKVIR